MQRSHSSSRPPAADPADFGIDYNPDRLTFPRFIGVAVGAGAVVTIMLAGLVNGWAN